MSSIKQKDPINFYDTVKVTVKSTDTDEILSENIVENTITTAGKNLLRDALIVPGPRQTLNYLAVGTGSPTANGLGIEVHRDMLDIPIISDATFTLTFYISSTECNGLILTEAALYTEAVGGVCFATTTYDHIDKSVSVTVIYEWTITIGV
jgi:hypothetical protein